LICHIENLVFYGVPNRSSVFLQPTVHCLVNLTEVPFFVLSLSDIEIAYFERVHFNVKNFDLVFVFKDYDRKVCHINSVASESLDTIKEWLDNIDIKYYEGPQNLAWDRIMTTIKEDPVKFHTEDGGWAFLNLESSDEEDSAPSEDEFDPEKEVSGSGGEEDPAEEDDEEEYESGGEPDEVEVDSEEEEEDEAGEDWDQLEEKARNHDIQVKEKKRARGESDSEEEEKRPKRGKKK